MAPLEHSTGDLSRKFVGGTAQTVEDGLKAKDGIVFLFVSADWAEYDLNISNVKVSKDNEIRIIVQILPDLIMCSCILIMCGKQCGPLHLALVAHCREFLWKITPPTMTRRVVEGSGTVDYLNIMWAIDSDFQLYRNVTESVGICNWRAKDQSKWDAFWYIYRRGDNTPGYSHIGLDQSATLNNQAHIAGKIKEAIDMVPDIQASMPTPSDKKKDRTSIIGSFFGTRSARKSTASG
mmetsp:Transcript_34818/g.69416  ORF Transcript_34818/g.69416 Transcript_34818/m.69416 type:complete len:236 (-) Transcript_34818:480-1187(-)